MGAEGSFQETECNRNFKMTSHLPVMRMSAATSPPPRARGIVLTEHADVACFICLLLLYE
jgi:hypothetical protein